MDGGGGGDINFSKEKEWGGDIYQNGVFIRIECGFFKTQRLFMLMGKTD